jgi:aminomethyltransferase
LADSYTQHGATSEYWACREAAAVIDLSPLRKYEVVGPDAELLMQTCVTRNVRKLADGQVVYTAMCHDTGTMIDDGTVFRLGRQNFRWIGGSDIGGLWLRQQAQERGLRVWVRDSTDQLHNLQVQGPNSRAIVDDVVWTRPDQPTVVELGWFRFAIGRIGDHLGIPIVLSRTGYTGELGYEIFCHPDDGPAVWDAIWAAGESRGLVPMGLAALDVLRIEAGLVFAGAEFSDQIDPFEAGIGFTVALKTTEEDFIGRAALVERKANPQRQLVGLELTGGEPGVSGDGVYIGRAQVGEITSGTISPILRQNIALARIAVQHGAIGTEVEIGKLDGHQKRIPATVVRFPFHDPDKTRVRG